MMGGTSDRRHVGDRHPTLPQAPVAVVQRAHIGHHPAVRLDVAISLAPGSGGLGLAGIPAF